MSDDTPIVVLFNALYTAQKFKKAKTWQDGYLKYLSAYSKLILYDDTKIRKLDSYFVRKMPEAGDEIEFDRHLVSIESFIEKKLDAAAINAKKSRETLTHSARSRTICYASIDIPIPTGPNSLLRNRLGRRTFPNKAWRAPQLCKPTTESHVTPMVIDSPPPSSATEPTADKPPTLADPTAFDQPSKPSDSETRKHVNVATAMPRMKRRRIGLSRASKALLTSVLENQTHLKKQTSDPDIPDEAEDVVHKPLEIDIKPKEVRRETIQANFKAKTFDQPVEFPSESNCEKIVKERSRLFRHTIAPERFTSVTCYKGYMLAMLYEHLNVTLVHIAVDFYAKNAIRLRNPQTGDMEVFFRNQGFPILVTNTSLYDFPSKKSKRNDEPTSIDQGDVYFALHLPNKSHSSTYSKDDIWVVSDSVKFDPVSTFIGRSTFYGPTSSGRVELKCLNARDAFVAKNVLANSESKNLYAIRAINGCSELMMIDNINDNLESLPLLPVLLDYKFSNERFCQPTRNDGRIIVDDASIDIVALLDEITEEFTLNYDQEKVLRTFALMTISAPGLSSEDNENDTPVILVHGVFGSGKSRLIAVLIIFIKRVITRLGEAMPYKILVSSMTNVAVDRILLELLKMGFDDIVRCGSLKKIAKPILPYTAQTMTNNDDKIKELKSMLQEDISPSEAEFVKDTIEKFKRMENRELISKALVVGTTCAASALEILDNIRFPLIILDEASQISEPLALVPMCRAECQKLVLVGDPQQLPPVLTTSSDKASLRKGLDRTLFDRSIEMGMKPIMLRTQYRCHPRISAISNDLYYNNRLLNGASVEKLKPLVTGLPTLCMIDVKGEERLHLRTKSLWNEREVNLILQTLDRLFELGVKGDDIGIIALYKQQVYRLQEKLNMQDCKRPAVKVSTVDAFQGAERDIIILSCVRTKTIGFSDSNERINVALTRARRHLLIVGHAQFLKSAPCWNRIISEHCMKAPDGYFDVIAFSRLIQTLSLNPNTTGTDDQKDEDNFLDWVMKLNRQYRTNASNLDMSINAKTDNTLNNIGTPECRTADLIVDNGQVESVLPVIDYKIDDGYAFDFDLAELDCLEDEI